MGVKKLLSRHSLFHSYTFILWMTAHWEISLLWFQSHVKRDFELNYIGYNDTQLLVMMFPVIFLPRQCNFYPRTLLHMQQEPFENLIMFLHEQIIALSPEEIDLFYSRFSSSHNWMNVLLEFPSFTRHFRRSGYYQKLGTTRFHKVVVYTVNTVTDHTE